MNELFLVPVVFAFLLAYNLWRLSDAVKARNRMANILDEFLVSDAPDDQKEVAYAFYKVSLYPWLLPVVTLHMIFSRRPNRGSHGTAVAIRNPDHLQFNRILFRGLVVVLKRAPIMSFVSILILLLMAIGKAVMNKLYYSESMEQLEDGIEKIAHRDFLRHPKF